MHCLGLQLAWAALQVTVANGDHIPCAGVVGHVVMCIGKEDFSISCFGIDLGVFNLILGVDYLHSLGPILWDFVDLFMSFWRGTHHVSWKGEGAPPCAARGLALRSLAGDPSCHCWNSSWSSTTQSSMSPPGYHRCARTTTGSTFYLA